MARYNKIFLGPVEKNKPQVREAIAAAALKPGRFVVDSSGEFALAGADTAGKVWLVQDNYLALEGVDDDWAADDTAIGIELEDGHLYAARIANGVNVTAKGAGLKLAANGTLAVATPGTDRIVAFAEEVFNNNTGSEQLIRIRVAGVPGPQGPQGEQGEPG